MAYNSLIFNKEFLKKVQKYLVVSIILTIFTLYQSQIKPPRCIGKPIML